MDLLKYIHGKCTGGEANRLERAAMEDPFLRDALEGYEKVPGDHGPVLDKLSRKVIRRSGSGTKIYFMAAAALLALVLLGSIALYLKGHDSNTEGAESLASGSQVARLNSKSKMLSRAERVEERFIPLIGTLEIVPNDEYKDFQPRELPDIAQQISVLDIISNDHEIVRIGHEAFVSSANEYSAHEVARLVPDIDQHKENVTTVQVRPERSTASAGAENRSVSDAVSDFMLFYENHLTPQYGPYGQKLAGKVELYFNTDTEGSPENISFGENVDVLLKREAERLVRLYEKWPPDCVIVKLVIDFSE